jgi:CRP-like cAMP-binding protein
MGEFVNKDIPNFFRFLEQIDPNSRQEILNASTCTSAERGDVICGQGEKSDAAYIIEKGVVEVVSFSEDWKQNRSIAYLSHGDIFGEMGILMNQKRVASIRACDQVVLRRFSEQAFLSLLNRIPGFAYFLCQHLAGRLHRVTSEKSYNSYCVDFGGNLMNFDMLLIFQTIASSGQSGELKITSPSNDLLGSFYFYGEMLRYARYGHLNGAESLWQIFLETKLEGSFAYQITAQPSAPYPRECEVNLRAGDVLLEAASKRDHFQNLPEHLQKLQGSLARLTDDFKWNTPQTAKTAEAIWQAIAKKPQLVASLWRRLNVCSLTLVEVIKGMIAGRLVQLTGIEPANPLSKP